MYVMSVHPPSFASFTMCRYCCCCCCCQVVKYIKRLPVRFTNLPEPKSSLVEKLVLKLQQQQFGNMRLTGKDGFEELLIAVLAAIAGLEGVSAPPQALQGAKVDSMNWQDAALLVLQTKQGGLGWLIV
jgi:hypothetical protein